MAWMSAAANEERLRIADTLLMADVICAAVRPSLADVASEPWHDAQLEA